MGRPWHGRDRRDVRPTIRLLIIAVAAPLRRHRNLGKHTEPIRKGVPIFRQRAWRSRAWRSGQPRLMGNGTARRPADRRASTRLKDLLTRPTEGVPRFTTPVAKDHGKPSLMGREGPVTQLCSMGSVTGLRPRGHGWSARSPRGGRSGIGDPRVCRGAGDQGHSRTMAASGVRRSRRYGEPAAECRWWAASRDLAGVRPQLKAVASGAGKGEVASGHRRRSPGLAAARRHRQTGAPQARASPVGGERTRRRRSARWRYGVGPTLRGRAPGAGRQQGADACLVLPVLCPARSMHRRIQQDKLGWSPCSFDQWQPSGQPGQVRQNPCGMPPGSRVDHLAKGLPGPDRRTEITLTGGRRHLDATGLGTRPALGVGRKPVGSRAHIPVRSSHLRLRPTRSWGMQVNHQTVHASCRQLRADGSTRPAWHQSVHHDE
jgi:hypothetical protein